MQIEYDGENKIRLIPENGIDRDVLCEMENDANLQKSFLLASESCGPDQGIDGLILECKRWEKIYKVEMKMKIAARDLVTARKKAKSFLKGEDEDEIEIKVYEVGED